MTNSVAEFDEKWFEPQRLRAALHLASGHTQQASADASGVTIRTVQRWLAEDDEFNRIVVQLAQESFRRVEPKVMRNMERCLDIQLDVLNGEMEPNDRRHAIADRFINRLLDRLFYVEPAANAGGPSSLAVQFNVGAQQGEQSRIEPPTDITPEA